MVWIGRDLERQPSPTSHHLVQHGCAEISSVDSFVPLKDLVLAAVGNRILN